MARLNLADIQALGASGAYQGTYTLGGESAALLLSWLACLHRWNWQGAGDALTDDEIDDIDEMVAGLLDEAMTPVEAGGMELATIITFAGATIPSDWLLCDGTQYDKVDYPDLYDALDSVFHVDSATFNVPDLGARVALGDGTRDGITYDVGDTGGEPVHTLTEAEMPEHTHELKVLRNAGDAAWVARGLSSLAPNGETEPTGSGDSHENRPPFLVLRWIIYAG